MDTSDTINYIDYFKALAALIFVISLMGGVSFLVRKYNLSPVIGADRKHKRLEVMETMMIDGRRRISIIRRDDKEHLILFGNQEETIIETFDSPKIDNQERIDDGEHTDDAK